MKLYKRTISTKDLHRLESFLINAITGEGLDFFESEWTQTAFYVRVGKGVKRVGVVHILERDKNLSDEQLAKIAKSNVTSWMEDCSKWVEFSSIDRAEE